MTIVHLSYARVNSAEPTKWLTEINFFTGILIEMRKEHNVKSIHCLNYQGILELDGVEYHFLKKGFFQVLFPWSIHTYLMKLKPDVVIVHGLQHGWQVLWLKLQARKKIRIFAQHHAERPQRFPKNIVQQFADYFIQGYFFVSHPMALPWVHAKQIKSFNKINEVMEASSTFGPIDKIESKRKTKLTGELIYLWVGRMDENKDPFTLVKAFLRFAREHQQARLYIIFKGGPLEKQIVQFVGEHCEGTAITVVGAIEHSSLLYWFNSSDFIISTSHYEGSGIAVCEAMSCGCIPILTDIPSFKMMTRNQECGILYPPGDVDILYEALQKSLLLDRELQSAKTKTLFETHLSFRAIANGILRALKEY